VASVLIASHHIIPASRLILYQSSLEVAPTHCNGILADRDFSTGYCLQFPTQVCFSATGAVSGGGAYTPFGHWRTTLQSGIGLRQSAELANHFLCCN